MEVDEVMAASVPGEPILADYRLAMAPRALAGALYLDLKLVVRVGRCADVFNLHQACRCLFWWATVWYGLVVYTF